MKKRTPPKMKTLLPHPHAPSGAWIECTRERRRDIRERAAKLFYDPSEREDVEIYAEPNRIALSAETLKRLECDGFSDAEFFELLAETPLWLMAPPFQEKLAVWQAIARDPFVLRESREEAQVHLKQVGETLAFVGQGAVKKDNFMMTTMLYCLIEADILPIWPELECAETLKEKERVFHERLPRYANFSHLAGGAYAPRTLAKAILGEMKNLSETTVKAHLAKGMPRLGNRNPHIPADK